MKIHFNINKVAFLLLLLAGVLASCNDYLTVYPLDKITEETFWEDKQDLEAVRYATYKQLISYDGTGDQINRMFLFGDVRANDLYTTNTTFNLSSQSSMVKLMQADIDTTDLTFDWHGFYSVIANCNRVLKYGDGILEKDPQFTQYEWSQMKAEMTAMRALCYFFLLKSYKYIPYTTKVVSNDSEIEAFKQVSDSIVLDSIIKDVEAIKGQSRNYYSSMDETKGLITNATIYCLLSDMYLWRASFYQGDGNNVKAIEYYNKCIEYSEYAICALRDQWEYDLNSTPGSDRSGYIKWTNAPKFRDVNGGLHDLDFMYQNDASEITVEGADASRFIKAYTQIFTNGNSYESFFELQYNIYSSMSTYLGTSGLLVPTYGSKDGVYEQTDGKDTPTTIARVYDMRHFFSAWPNLSGTTTSSASDYYCLKWCGAEPKISDKVGEADPKIEMNLPSTDAEKKTRASNQHWIIYRLSDALLQKAEAHACLAKLDQNKTENNNICKQILRMVNRRWYASVTAAYSGTPSLDVSKDESGSTKASTLYKSYENAFYESDMLTNVMKTRKIEFVGEGKRWFDLVRWAIRENKGHTTDDKDHFYDYDPGMNKMFNAFINTDNNKNWQTTMNRCVNMWGLYCPIYYWEVKAYRAMNAPIQQNPIWNKSRYDR